MTPLVSMQRRCIRPAVCWCAVLLFALSCPGTGPAAADEGRSAADIKADIERKRAEIQRKAAEMRANNARRRAEIQARTPAVNGSATPSVANGALREFGSAEGKFTVLMPGKPKAQTLGVAGVAMKTFSVEEKNGAYVVAFADTPIPPGETSDQIQQRLQGARDGMLHNINARLTSEYSVSLNGKYLGREVNADLPGNKGILRARVYVVGRRVYQILVVGTSSWASSADATKFLNSLAVTP